MRDESFSMDTAVAVGIPVVPLAQPLVRSRPPGRWAIRTPLRADLPVGTPNWWVASGFRRAPASGGASSETWFHPAGVLALGPSAAAQWTLLGVRSLGLFHKEIDRWQVHRFDGESRAALEFDSDGMGYEMIRCRCPANHLIQALSLIQRSARLAPFEIMSRLSRQNFWVGNLGAKGFDVSGAPRWTHEALHGIDLPLGLQEIMVWIGQGECALAELPASLTLFTLLRNLGKHRVLRYPRGEEAMQRRRWADSALVQGGGLEFKVASDGLTQGVCWASALVDLDRGSVQLAERLGLWIETAPIATLRAAVAGAPPILPPLPALLVHATRRCFSAHDPIHLALLQALRTLVERTPAEVKRTWALASPWAVVRARPNPSSVDRFPLDWVGTLAVAQARMCTEAGLAWPGPTAEEEAAWASLPPAMASPIQNEWRRQRLEKDLAIPLRAPAVRPRF